MDEKAFHRVTPVIAIAGVLITAACHLFGGWHTALGAIGGTVLALANWQSIRWVVRRIATGSTQRRAAVTMGLGPKLAALAACVYIALQMFHLDAVGLCAGLSSLVVGLLVATLGAQAAALEGS